MVFYLTQITAIAALICWVVRVVEYKLVRVKSEFWDIYPACFLSMIGVTALTNLVWFLLYKFWIVYIISKWAIIFGVHTLIFKAMIKRRLSHTLWMASSATATLFILIYALSALGINV